MKSRNGKSPRRPERAGAAPGRKSAGKPPGKPGGKPAGKPSGKPQRGSSGSRSGAEARASAKPGAGKARDEASRGRDKARWVVGIHSCEETLKVRPKTIRELLVREDFESSEQLRELADKARAAHIVVRPRTQGQLDQVGAGHQGVALAVTENPEVAWDQLAEPGQKLVLLLDGIEDPQNLGSIIRTAWLTGVSAIFIPTDRAVGLTPSTCKVASGGTEHVPLESEPNLPSVMKRLKDIGFWIYGLSEKGERKPWEFQLPEKVAWVIGSEGSGMRIPTERACDELVRIPQASSGSSYNAAIAAAMALSETCRQFGKPE